jgi:hypothetical protein
MKKFIYLSLSLMVLSSCGHRNSNKQSDSSQNISPDPLFSSPIERNNFSLDLNIGGWSRDTTQSLFENFSDPDLQSLLSTNLDARELSILGCKNFNLLDVDQKKIFLIVFIAAIADLESDFDTNDETYDKYHKNINVGLLQIDIASAKRHAPGLIFSSFSNEDLKDQKLNLHIGAYILKNQISGKWREDARGRLFPNRTYYWEVLNQRNRFKFMKAFKNNLEFLTFCHE